MYHAGIAAESTRVWSNSSACNAENPGKIQFTAKSMSHWVLDLWVNRKYTSPPDSQHIPYKIPADCKKKTLIKKSLYGFKSIHSNDVIAHAHVLYR